MTDLVCDDATAHAVLDLAEAESSARKDKG
jgi:hypothetical protein